MVIEPSCEFTGYSHVNKRLGKYYSKCHISTLVMLSLSVEVSVFCECRSGLYLLLLPKPDVENEEDAIYPDVIIHSRGNHDENQVIEVKKTSNTDNRDEDKSRLEILTNDGYDERFDYDQGLFLLLPVAEKWEDEPDTIWYP